MEMVTETAQHRATPLTPMSIFINLYGAMLVGLLDGGHDPRLPIVEY